MKRLLLSLLLVLLLCPVAHASKRVALVIGNGAYSDAPLANPVNDARSMGNALKKLGFKATVLTNVSKRAMIDAIRTFGKQLKPGSTGLFYFAGHGMQVKGINYLLPVGANVHSEADVEFEGVDAGRILQSMEAARNEVNIVILDACRNNPYARATRSSTRGLARMDAPSGSFIAYATAPGKVAADGTGSNGVFTAALLKNISTPGMDIDDMFRSVRVAVMKSTGNKQIPWQSSSMTKEFYFQKNKDWAGTLDKKSAEYKRLKALADKKAADDKKRAAEEAVYKARIAKMDADVEAMKKRLGSGTALPDDSLQAMLAIVKQKKEENRKLAALRKVRAAEEAKRTAKMRTIELKRIRAIKPAFMKDAAAYKEIVNSEYGAAMADTAWGTLVRKYPLVAAGCAKGDIDAMIAKFPREAGDIWTDPTTDMKFVWVPAGSFMMGSPSSEYKRGSDEGPVHRVTLKKGFWIGKYEVTQDEWTRIMGSNPSKFKGGRNPVEKVSWKNALMFIDKLNALGKAKFALPSESQWEYAARGGTTTPFHFGSTINSNNQANFDGNYAYGHGSKGVNRGRTSHVGTFPPNRYGLHDVHGNVWEWCADRYHEDYSGAPSDGSAWMKGKDKDRIIRGGSWSQEPRGIRSALRGGTHYNSKYDDIGFRLIRIE